MATSIPSLLMSMLYIGWPVTIFLPSTFFLELPMILKSLTSFRVTSSGAVSLAAAAANSPYPADFPLEECLNVPDSVVISSIGTPQD